MGLHSMEEKIGSISSGLAAMQNHLQTYKQTLNWLQEEKSNIVSTITTVLAVEKKLSIVNTSLNDLSDDTSRRLRAVDKKVNSTSTGLNTMNNAATDSSARLQK